MASNPHPLLLHARSCPCISQKILCTSPANPAADCYPCWSQLKESQQREQALSADLEAAKKAQQEAQQQLQQAQSQVQAAKDAPMSTSSPSHRSMENGILLPQQHLLPACLITSILWLSITVHVHVAPWCMVESLTAIPVVISRVFSLCLCTRLSAIYLLPEHALPVCLTEACNAVQHLNMRRSSLVPQTYNCSESRQGQMLDPCHMESAA